MPMTVVPGFTIATVVGGGSNTGRVTWYQTGHAYVNQTGQAAIFTQVAAYVASRPSTGAETGQKWSGQSGWYHCLNADLASQAALLATLLQTAANITGPTS